MDRLAGVRLAVHRRACAWSKQQASQRVLGRSPLQ
jgi:hypothetical protein